MINLTIINHLPIISWRKIIRGLNEIMKELDTPKHGSHVTLQGAPANGPQEYFKRWFCVGLYPSGKTFKQEAETMAPFSNTLNESLISWVDFFSDDPVKDLPVVAAQMGFSETLIASLSGDTPLNYQDFDTEMWMRLPSIQIRGTNVNSYPLFF